jgi:NADH:ubiquinone oxidoreductase subunit 6 (subunit J)
LESAVFYIVAVFTVAAAAVTAFSQNIVRSAFALLGALVGVAVVFGMAGADFLAVIQVMIYVGGVMILILFAVMLTNRIAEVNVSNRSLPMVPAAVVSGAVLAMLLYGIWKGVPVGEARVEARMAPEIGKALITGYALPFIVAGVVLLSALVGAAVIARRYVPPSCEVPEPKGGGTEESGVKK